MTLEQLRALARDWLDDDVSPPLWPDERIDQYLNEAVREAAVRARLLLDSATASVCQIALVVDQAAYTLDPSVIVVRRAATDLDPQHPLERVLFHALDEVRPHWRTDKGRPRYLVQDLQRGSLTVSPIPTEVDVLRLVVMRYPIASELMTAPTHVPPIGAQYHESLCHWVLWRALMKRDVEQYSPKDAETHYGLFEATFGKKVTAQQLQLLAIDPGGSTTSYFF